MDGQAFNRMNHAMIFATLLVAAHTVLLLFGTTLSAFGDTSLILAERGALNEVGPLLKVAVAMLPAAVWLDKRRQATAAP
jgi:hypothetical protein